MKLLLTDCATLTQNHDLSLDGFGRFGTVAAFESITRERLLQEVYDTDVILCNKTVIDRKVIESAPKLKYIGLFATGYNNIDIACATEHHIAVCNAGSYSTDAVAQQVFAYILSHYSMVDQYSSLVANGGWTSSPTFSVLSYPTDELAGKTLGIIGYGSIGKKVEQIAKAFDMQVLVYTRTLPESSATAFVSFDTLLAESDIITAHCPLNAQNARLFNAEAFAKMKNGAFFINTARGGVVDEQALHDALANGKLAGAAIDVLDHEPMLPDCVLKDTPNLMITPHTAWAPLTTRKRLVSIVEDNLQSFLQGNPKNVVNPEYDR